MPTYDWSCLACGNANMANQGNCVMCGCPAHASTTEVEVHRERHVGEGGEVKGNAGLLSQEADFEILKVFGKLILKLFPGSLILWIWR